MAIANVTLTNTFDEWRTVTNQIISFVNDVDAGNLTKFYSNSAALTVTENVARGGKNYITLNTSSNVLDTSTLNVATANAVNIVFAALANTDARLVLVSNDANVINSISNAAFIQANTARNHANTAHGSANAAHNSANAGLLQANVARDHANAAFLAANSAVTDYSPALIQANTARVHANLAYAQANAVYDLANIALGNVTTTIESNKAAFDLANISYVQANTARNHANAAFLAANNAVTDYSPAFIQANTARNHANAAFLAANNAVTDYSPAFIQANTARVHANVSFEQANTARDHANAAFAAANAASTGSATDAFIQANTARVHANAAFLKANNALANVSGISFAGNLTVTGIYATLNVGIGTLIPNSFVSLHTTGAIMSNGSVAPSSAGVNGAILMDYSDSTGGRVIAFSSNNAVRAPLRLGVATAEIAGQTLLYPAILDQSGNVSLGGTTRVYVDNVSGNTGFGRTDPRYRVDIVGIANASNVLVNQNMALTTQNYNSYAPTLTGTGASGTWSISISGSAGSAYQASYASYAYELIGGSAGKIPYQTSGSSTDFTAVGTSGQVLISGGTGAPSWTSSPQFTAVGVGTAAGTSGTIRATGDITAFYSDARLKTDIQTISNALEKVKQISGVTYVNNDLANEFGFNSKDRMAGVLAQEIEAVLPEVVTLAPFDMGDTDENGNTTSLSGENYKTVKYDKLVPLLIEAIKDLSNQVEELKKKIN